MLLVCVWVLFLCCPSSSLSLRERKKRAILHIGPHKSGSAIIERGLIDFQPFFRSSGFKTSPSSEMGEATVGLGPLLDSILKKPTELMRELKEAKTDWIISSETLGKLKEDQISKLSSIFRDYDVTVVADFQDPFAHLRSCWFEKSREPREKVYIFPSFVQTVLDSLTNGTLARTHPVLEMRRTLGLYEKYYGASSIVLIDFDGVWERGLSVLGVLIYDIADLPIPPAFDRRQGDHREDEEDISTAINIWGSSHDYAPISISPLDFYLSLNNDGELKELVERGKASMFAHCKVGGNWERLDRLLRRHFSEWLESCGYPLLYPTELNWGMGDELVNCLVVGITFFPSLLTSLLSRRVSRRNTNDNNNNENKSDD